MKKPSTRRGKQKSFKKFCNAYIITIFASLVNKKAPKFVSNFTKRIRYARLRAAVASRRLTDAITILEHAGITDTLHQQFILGMVQMRGVHNG